MPTFNPPTSNDVGPINPDSTGPGARLMRYYSSRPRGHNVWLLADGTFTDDVQPYPLISTEDAAKGNLPLGIYTQATYQKVYYGGHANVITAAEATALTAAGYGAYIT